MEPMSGPQGSNTAGTLVSGATRRDAASVARRRGWAGRSAPPDRPQQLDHNRIPTTAQHRGATTPAVPQEGAMTARPPQGRRPGSARARPASGSAPQPRPRPQRPSSPSSPPPSSPPGSSSRTSSCARSAAASCCASSSTATTASPSTRSPPLSRAVAEALDSSDVLGDEPYTLEVSSPGVDRPLTAPRHWRRNVGRLVAVTRTDARALAGRLVSVTDEADRGARVLVKGRISRATLALADVRRAVVQVEFSRTAAAGLDTDETTPRRRRRRRRPTTPRRREGLSAMDIDVSALKALVREKDLSYDVVVQTIERRCCSPTTAPRGPPSRARRARPQDRARHRLGPRGGRRGRHPGREYDDTPTASAASRPRPRAR